MARDIRRPKRDDAGLKAITSDPDKDFEIAGSEVVSSEAEMDGENDEDYKDDDIDMSEDDESAHFSLPPSPHKPITLGNSKDDGTMFRRGSEHTCLRQQIVTLIQTGPSQFALLAPVAGEVVGEIAVEWEVSPAVGMMEEEKRATEITTGRGEAQMRVSLPLRRTAMRSWRRRKMTADVPEMAIVAALSKPWEDQWESSPAHTKKQSKKEMLDLRRRAIHALGSETCFTALRRYNFMMTFTMRRTAMEDYVSMSQDGWDAVTRREWNGMVFKRYEVRLGTESGKKQVVRRGRGGRRTMAFILCKG